MNKYLFSLLLIFGLSCESKLELQEINVTSQAADETEGEDCDTEDCGDDSGDDNSSGSGGSAPSDITDFKIDLLTSELFKFNFNTTLKSVAKLEYGTSTSYGSETPFTTNYKKNDHFVNTPLNLDLNANTIYYYRIHVKNQAGTVSHKTGYIRTLHQPTGQLLHHLDVQELSISYHPNLNSTGWHTALFQAIKHWNNIRGTNIYIHPPIQSSTPISGTVYITDDPSTRLNIDGVDAARYFDEDGDRLAVADRQYLSDANNTNSITRPKSLVINPNPNATPNSQIKRKVLIHELFHFLGFNHTTENAIYYDHHDPTFGASFLRLSVADNSLFLTDPTKNAEYILETDKEHLRSFYPSSDKWISGMSTVTNTSGNYTYQSVSMGTIDAFDYVWEWRIPGSNNWTTIGPNSSTITFVYPRNGDIDLRVTTYKKDHPGVDQLQERKTIKKFIDNESGKGGVDSLL